MGEGPFEAVRRDRLVNQAVDTYVVRVLREVDAAPGDPLARAQAALRVQSPERRALRSELRRAWRSAFESSGFGGRLAEAFARQLTGRLDGVGEQWVVRELLARRRDLRGLHVN